MNDDPEEATDAEDLEALRAAVRAEVEKQVAEKVADGEMLQTRPGVYAFIQKPARDGFGESLN